MVEVLIEVALKDRGVLRRLSARFLPMSPGALVAATREAIAQATYFDPRHLNHNFDYDYEAYAEGQQNLGCLTQAGELRLAMELAIELITHGSHQVEASDEGLMTQDIENCLIPVIRAVETSTLPAAEGIAWCSAMLHSDRVGFIARERLESLRAQFQAVAAPNPAVE